jgi:hypothetical protein
MIKKLIFSSFLLFLFQIAVFAQFEDTTQMRDPQYISTAEQLAQDLSTRLSLTEEQSEEIKEILVDFQENVAIHRTEADEAETYRNETDYDTEPQSDIETETDFETDTETTLPRTETDVDVDADVRTDYPETDVDADVRTDYPETEVDTEVRTDFPQTDVDVDMRTQIETEDPQEMANQAIEEVLNESQMVTWNVIKEAWWRDVSNRYGWDMDNTR